MPESVFVDGVEINRKNSLVFNYVYGDDRPEAFSYKCFVNDFFQTVNGDIFLSVCVTHIGNSEYHGLNRIFNTNYIVRDTLMRQPK